MSLTPEQRAEKISSRLFEQLYFVSNLNDEMRILVLRMTVDKLLDSDKAMTALGMIELLKLYEAAQKAYDEFMGVSK